ncbi:WXG100 family type VII secretion target [Lachnospiraceae bacterium M18-1]|nr:WXG100 family type VII secretion target [Lachnospiraceae bacterium M18-1]
MADRIKLSASEASSAVRSIKGKAQEAQSVVGNLQRDIGNVKSWWEGDSAIAFVEEFSKSKKEFDKMIECINKYGDMLMKAIEIQQKADADIARQMRS